MNKNKPKKIQKTNIKPFQEKKMSKVTSFEVQKTITMRKHQKIFVNLFFLSSQDYRYVTKIQNT